MTKNSVFLLNQIFYCHGFLFFWLIHMKTCLIVLIPFLESIILYQFISLLILSYNILYNHIMLFYVQKQTFLTLTSFLWCNLIVYIHYVVLRANIKFLAYPLGQLNIACIHRLQKVSCDTRPQLTIMHYNMIFPRFTVITELVFKFYAIYIICIISYFYVSHILFVHFTHRKKFNYLFYTHYLSFYRVFDEFIGFFKFIKEHTIYIRWLLCWLSHFLYPIPEVWCISYSKILYYIYTEHLCTRILFYDNVK